MWRFKYTLPLHQKATKIKLYKKWSDFRLSSAFNWVLLLGFVIGVGSGLGVSLPGGVRALLSGEPVAHRFTSSDHDNKTATLLNSDYIVWSESEQDGTSISLNVYKRATGESVVKSEVGANYSLYGLTGQSVLVTKTYGEGLTEQTNYIYDIEDDQFYELQIEDEVGGDFVARMGGNIVTIMQGLETYYYDLEVDTDGDTIPNYKEPVSVSPDLALHHLFTNFSQYSFPISTNGLIVYTDWELSTYKTYVYDTVSQTRHLLPNDFATETGVTTVMAGSSFGRAIDSDGGKQLIYYDFATDTDNDGLANYKDNDNPSPNPAVKSFDFETSYFACGATTGNTFAFSGDAVSWCDESNKVYYYSFSEAEKKLVTNNTGGEGSLYNVYGDTAVFFSDRDERINQFFYTQFDIDNTEPAFVNLPNQSTKLNYANDQLLDTHIVTPAVKPLDSGSGIAKVEFFVDDAREATDYVAGSGGIYEASITLKWNRPGGVTLRAVAYDKANNSVSTSVNIQPNPLIFPYTNPVAKTSNSGTGLDSRNGDIDGDNIVYYNNDENTGFRSLVVQNILTGAKNVIQAGAKNIYPPRIAGNYVVSRVAAYSDELGQDEYGLYLYNILNGQKIKIIDPGICYPQYDVYQGAVYWICGDDATLYKYDIQTAEQTTVGVFAGYEPTGLSVGKDSLFVSLYHIANQQHLIQKVSLADFASSEYLSDSYSGYGDWKLSYSYPYLAAIGSEAGNYSIFLSNVATGQTKIIETDREPAYRLSVSSRYVAWEDSDVSNNCGDERITVYDIIKDRLYYLNNTITSEGLCYDSDYPALYGSVVTWNTDYPGDTTEENIYITDIRYLDIIDPVIISASGLYGVTGGTANISVKATDNVRPTSARVSINGGDFVKMNGSASPFTYGVPIPLDWAEDTYPIKVRVYDVTGNYIEKSYVIAVNDEVAPTINNIEIPKGTTGEDAVIKISASDNIYLDKVEININGAGYQLATFKDGLYQYAYKVPANSANDPSFDVRATDLTERTDESKGNVLTVTDNDPPVITRVVATNMERGHGGTITAYATDNIAPTRATIMLDGVTWGSMGGSASPFAYTIAGRSIGEGDSLRYFVRVYDAAGNYDSTEPNTAPVINDTTPEADQNVVQKALTIVQGVIENVVKNTPEPVAKSFPYILFAVLLVSAYIFTVQARKEAEQASQKLEMVQFRKVIAEEKSNFVILVSHYLRTPLTLISSGIDELLKKQKGARADAIHRSNDHLGMVIQQLVSDIESDTGIKNIKNPNIKTEGIRAYASPFIIVPAIGVGALVLYANYLFRNVAKIDLGLVNMITQGVVFVVVIQVFAYFLRKKQNQHNNLKYFNQTIEYQVAVDEARTELLVNARAKVNGALADLRHDLGRAGNEYVEEGIRRMDAILAKMGYLAGLKFQDIQSSKKVTHLQDLVDHIVGAKKSLITDKKLKTKVSLSTLKTTKSNKVVTEILSEIVDNAIKFSPKSGVVVVKGEVKDGLNRITIIDQGRGISRREQLYIFKPFSRTSSALNFEYEGIGLGLYYARSLANMLGGEVYIKSAEGKGTEVTIVL